MKPRKDAKSSCAAFFDSTGLPMSGGVERGLSEERGCRWEASWSHTCTESAGPIPSQTPARRIGWTFTVLLSVCSPALGGIDAINGVYDSQSVLFEVSFTDPAPLAEGWTFQLFIDSDNDKLTGYGGGFDKMVRGVEGVGGVDLDHATHVHLRETEDGVGPGGWGLVIADICFSMADNDLLLGFVIPLNTPGSPEGGSFCYAFEIYHDGRLRDWVYGRCTAAGNPTPDFACDCVLDECDDGNECTDDRCLSDGSCENTPNDSLCPEDGVYCNGPEVCDAEAGCVSAGDPCPGLCDEQGTPHCPCEAPDVSAAGSRYLAIRPKPLDSDVPVKLRVDWPAGDDSPCMSGYVGSLRCGGLGDQCTGDADCNQCSFAQTPCVVDEDCNFGLCSDGSQCTVVPGYCADQSPCLRAENCVLSGDLCEVAPLQTIDINRDGLIDGTLAVLVDEASAAELTPAEWTAEVMRCSKSAAPCVADVDCTRGRCADSGSFCAVFGSDCGRAECLLDEECVSGAVYVYGEEIVPSEVLGTSDIIVPTAYDVVAECVGDTLPIVTAPVSATMWRWADTNNDGFMNMADILLQLLGMKGSYVYTTLLNDDLAGMDSCWVDQILNIADVFWALRAFEFKEHYYNTGCNNPTCP